MLHATHQITSARESDHRGITFAAPTVDLAKLRAWKESILTKLGAGVAQLAKMRNVQVIQGKAYFEGSQTLRVENEQGQQFVNFETAIVAVGSLPALPKAFDLGNPRDHDFDGGVGDRGYPGESARGRRRLHRDGDGDDLCRARQQGHGGRGAR